MLRLSWSYQPCTSLPGNHLAADALQKNTIMQGHSPQPALQVSKNHRLGERLPRTFQAVSSSVLRCSPAVASICCTLSTSPVPAYAQVSNTTWQYWEMCSSSVLATCKNHSRGHHSSRKRSWWIPAWA